MLVQNVFVYSVVSVLVLILQAGLVAADDKTTQSEALQEFLLRVETEPGNPFARRSRQKLNDAGEIVELNLRGVTFDPGNTRIVAELKRLRVLNLSNTNVSDADLKPLNSLPRLEKLSLTGTKITDAGAMHIAQMKSLTHLDLCDTAITDKAFSQLAALPVLQHLDLARTKLTDESAESFKELTSLTSIKLTETRVGDSVLRNLATLPLLRCVTLGDTAATAKGIDQLGRLERMQWMASDELTAREFVNRISQEAHEDADMMTCFGLNLPRTGDFSTRSVVQHPNTPRDDDLQRTRWRAEWDWKVNGKDQGLYAEIAIQQRTVIVTSAGILD
ncbi:MAG: leucine-rich repeat domain-containing protein [Planctomycetaceae bacterium]